VPLHRELQGWQQHQLRVQQLLHLQQQQQVEWMQDLQALQQRLQQLQGARQQVSAGQSVVFAVKSAYSVCSEGAKECRPCLPLSP
jgi:hypothetical protein